MKYDGIGENERIKTISEWHERARLLTAEDFKSVKEHYGYDRKLSEIPYSVNRSPDAPLNLFDGALAIETATDDLRSCAAQMARRNFEKAVPNWRTFANMPRILQLRTVFEHSYYTFWADEKKLPESDDNLDCGIASTETEEHYMRCRFLEALMAYLTFGARCSVEFGPPFLQNWLLAINILRKRLHINSGRDLDESEANQMVRAIENAIFDIQTAIHIISSTNDPDDAPEKVNGSFFIAEDEAFGISCDRTNFAKVNSDEDWLEKHDGVTVGNRFLVSYTPQKGLSLRDVIRCKNPRSGNYYYPSIASRKSKVRLNAVVTLLRSLERNPLEFCRAPKDVNWRGAFQKSHSKEAAANIPHRFKKEQIFVSGNSSGFKVSRWRFYTEDEIRNNVSKKRRQRPSRRCNEDVIFP